MPRKKNRRKELQRKKRQAEGQPRKRRVIALNPAHHAGGASLALLAASVFRTCRKETPDDQ